MKKRKETHDSISFSGNEVDGKTIMPSNEGVTGPDPTVKTSPYTDEDYPGSQGTFVPGEAWSDGRDRVIFDSKDKIPGRYQFNTTILEEPTGLEADEETDNRYLNYFNRPDIDGWELRRSLQMLFVRSPNSLPLCIALST